MAVRDNAHVLGNPPRMGKGGRRDGAKARENDRERQPSRASVIGVVNGGTQPEGLKDEYMDSSPDGMHAWDRSRVVPTDKVTRGKCYLGGLRS